MRPALLLLAALVSGFAPAPFPKPPKAAPKDDLKALEGEWRRESLFIDGKPARNVNVSTIKAGLWAFGSPDDVWAITLDASTTPRRINCHPVKAGLGRQPFWGVYRLEGDTLHHCCRQGKDKSARPVGFDPNQPNMWLAVYRRVKR